MSAGSDERAAGRLRTDPAASSPDDLYAALIDAHRGLADAQSRQLDARLVLLLANHVGDPTILAEAIAAARRGLDGDTATDRSD